MAKLFAGLLIRLLSYVLKLHIDYKQIDKKAAEDWGYKSFDDKGWRSYFAYEDLKILKEFSFGKERDAYMILVGRRLQLLYIFNEMKKAYQNKKSAEDKKQSAAAKDSK